MNEDFVTYEQAVKLKELGFDWVCYAYYDKRRQDGVIDRALKFQNYNYDDDYMNSVSAPTLAQVQKWLIEKGIFVEVIISIRGTFYYVLENCKDVGYSLTRPDGKYYDTYEQALSAGIDKTLELLKEQ